MKSLRLLPLLIVLALHHNLGAQHRFIENGRQWPGEVQHRTDIPGGYLYLEQGAFTTALYDVETVSRVFAAHRGGTPIPPPQQLQCHAYRMEFVGSNASANVEGHRTADTRYNFFLGSDTARWSGGLRAHAEVRYENLYPGIDLKVYRSTNLKYDFILQPGADPSLIRMQYEGVKPKLQKDGSLLIQTAVGEVLESPPFAYQYIHGQLQKVACRFRFYGKELGFELGSYDPSRSLVIDPELIFSTYSGSFADNFGFTATYDGEGHLYGAGSVYGMGYPTTLGAFQTVWAGGAVADGLVGTDISISKFNLDGTSLIYSTYLGGAGDELPHSLVCDEENRLYMLGTTGSANYPITAGAFQNTFLGGTPTTLMGVGINYILGCDMVITAFNPEGSALLGSTYMGGSLNDGVNTSEFLRANYADEMRGEIEIDDGGRVVVGSSTFSEDFPITEGSFQTVKSAVQEGVVFVMNPSLTELIASTYYGGDGSDAIYAIDVSHNVITVGGGTRSTDLPMAGTPFQENFAGGTADGFVATFSTDLSSLEAASYYGSEAYDQIYFVERDKLGNPHIYGQTRATGNTFVSNAAFNVPNSGMLLSKFSPNLDQRIWSTVFGNGVNVPNLSPSAFSVDICNRVYLSGWGGAINTQGNTFNMPITPDAIQSTTTGSDFYFLVMEADASELTFGSYFGGPVSAEHVDGGTSRFDKTGRIYQAVCAGCGGNDDFPIFPENAHSPTNNSNNNNCNMGVAKIDFDLPRLLASFSAQTQCLPLPTTFSNSSLTTPGQNSYLWNFGDGNTSNDPNPTHTYASPGTYTVSLTVLNPLSCNLADSTQLSIEVFPGVDLNLPETVFSCSDTLFELSALSGGTAAQYTWASDPGFQNILLQGPADSVLSFSTTSISTVYLQGINGPCSASASVHVFPPPQMVLGELPALYCSIDTVVVEAFTTPGEFTNFLWEPDELLVSGQGSATATLVPELGFSITASALSPFGCPVSASLSAEVFPIALSASPDTVACFDEPILLQASSSGTAELLLWSDDLAFNNILNQPGDSNITVVPGSYQYYYVQAVNGPCIRIDSVGVGSLQLGISPDSDRLVCAGDTVRIAVNSDFPNSGLMYNWEPVELILSGQGSNSILAVVAEQATFSVLSSFANGDCPLESAITIFTSELGNIEINATAEPSLVVPGGSSNLSASPAIEGLNYFWSPPTYLSTTIGAQVSAVPQSSITYTVTVSDFSDIGVCSKDAQVSLEVVDFVCGEPYIYVPNAFSPNGDGENEVLYVRGQNIAQMSFSVYDRWGERVFQTEKQEEGWDGSYKGRMAAPAVFVYHLEVDCGDGRRHFQKGNVTLVR